MTWIQGQLDNAGIWRYNDGTEMQYFNWSIQESQPDRRADEIVVVVKKSNGYLWHDVYTSERAPVMCQRK